MGDDVEGPFVAEADAAGRDDLVPVPQEWTWAHMRRFADFVSDVRGEWQGYPVLLDDFDVRLADGHPLKEAYERHNGTEFEIVVCGPSEVRDDETVVNSWYDGKRNRDVYIFRRGDGRAFAGTVQRAPDRSMERLTLWIRTMGAADAWDLDAEAKAIEKLAGMITAQQRRHYLLTGSFLETSKRSRLTYVFRRLRPTIAMTPRWKWWLGPQDNMRCLAVLCLHPVGFYDRTWAGCMVPTDDVIAHLLMMRGDEALFWRKANQHEPDAPEAGL